MNTPEARLILENGLRRIIAEYYLYHRIRGLKINFRVKATPAEVRKHYKQNRAYYKKRGLKERAALGVIERTLLNMRREQVKTRLMLLRKRIIEEQRDKSGYRVRNPEKFR